MSKCKQTACQIFRARKYSLFIQCHIYRLRCPCFSLLTQFVIVKINQLYSFFLPREIIFCPSALNIRRDRLESRASKVAPAYLNLGKAHRKAAR